MILWLADISAFTCLTYFQKTRWDTYVRSMLSLMHCAEESHSSFYTHSLFFWKHKGSDYPFSQQPLKVLPCVVSGGLTSPWSSISISFGKEEARKLHVCRRNLVGIQTNTWILNFHRYLCLRSLTRNQFLSKNLQDLEGLSIFSGSVLFFPHWRMLRDGTQGVPWLIQWAAPATQSRHYSCYFKLITFHL